MTTYQHPSIVRSLRLALALAVVCGCGFAGWRAGARELGWHWLPGAPFAPGAALNFDGVNDYVSIPPSGNLPLTSPFTVETWIYVIRMSGSSCQRTFCEDDSARLRWT